MIREVLLAGSRGWLRNVATAFVFLAGVFSAAPAAFAADAFSGLLAYEGFEYPAGNSLAGGTANFNSLTVTKLKSIWPAP